MALLNPGFGVLRGSSMAWRMLARRIMQLCLATARLPAGCATMASKDGSLA